MKKNVIRLLFALVAILTSTSMLAENKLWIASQGEGEFAIMMDCDQEVAGLQFNLMLPDALEIKQVTNEGREQYIYRNPERFNNGQQIRSGLIDNDKHAVVCMIVSMQGESFRGEQGTPVAYFKTNKVSSTSTWENKDLKLTDIVFSTANGDQLSSAEESVYDGAVYGVVRAYFDVDNIIINPNTSDIQIPVALTNSFNVSALQMNIVLPEGFTLSNTEFEHTDRVSTTAQIRSEANGSTYSLVMSDVIDNMSIMAGDGVIFYCFVNAPDAEAFASDAVMTIENVGASNIDGTYVGGLGSSLNITNGVIAKNNADAEIARLREALETALATIAETCPDVKDNFLGTEISTSIDELEAAVNEAYENLSLTPDYETIMAPVAGIDEAIEQLVVDAKAAQEAEVERRANNQAKYEETIAALDALQVNLDNAITLIDSDYADYKDEEAIAAAQAMIDTARAEADAAYEAVAAAGDYAYEFDQAAINTAIEGLVLSAEAAKAAAEAEAARKAANEKAYNDVLAAIEAIQAHYDETVAAIKADYAEFEDAEAEARVQAQIDAARELADAAYANVAEEGNFEFTVDADNLNKAIDALLQTAKDKKEGNEAALEAARQEANKAAYEGDLATLDELYSLYRSVVSEIQSSYPAYENVSAELAVRNKLDDVKSEIEKAYKAVEKEGNYSYTLDYETLKASIEKLLSDAKAAAEKAEADRKARNEAAYNAVMEEIEALKAEANAAIDKISAEYPSYNATNEIREIDSAIAAAENGAKEAYAACAEEGEFDFPFDAQLIRDLIEKMLENAEADGVEEIEAEAVAGEAYIFTLDGKQHQRPVHGEVNVIVRKNGKNSKVYIK